MSGRRLAATLIGGAMLGCAGCIGDDGSVKKLSVYPVKGSVVLADGKPLQGGRIYFVPKDGAVTAEGTLATDGTFSLQTGGSGDGAPAGDYKVRLEPENTALLAGKKASGGKPLPFAQKYLDEDSSGLAATVKAEPNQLEPFRLR